jgi:hypothetical protein
MMIASDSTYAFGWDDDYECVWVENGVRTFATFHQWTLQPVHADGAPRRHEAEAYMRGLRTGLTTFRRFEMGSAVSFLPWVRDIETGLEIKQTRRDMPVDRMMIIIGRNDRVGFSFDVSYRYDDEKKRLVYTAPLEKVTALYQTNLSRLPEFPSEENFVTKLREGIKIMLAHREHWSSVLFELTSDVA